jgi:hypothetical protein
LGLTLSGSYRVMAPGDDDTSDKDVDDDKVAIARPGESGPGSYVGETSSDDAIDARETGAEARSEQKNRDIESFARVPRFVRVRYVPGRGTAVTEPLGKIGLFFPPTYLSVKYDTDGHGRDLYQVLQRWRRFDDADVVAYSPRS